VSLVGKKMRLARIFKEDEKAFVIAMDHGVELGPVSGLEDIRSTIKKVLVVDCKPDALLMTPSMLRLCHQELTGKVGVITRLDGATTTMGPDITNYRLISSVEEALVCGADAVASMAFVGVENESQNLERIGKVSQECLKFGMPHVVEALPPEIVEHHFKPKARWRWPDPEHVKFVDRVAAELGADVVKSYYTGDMETFREVVKCCPVPIIVLSGPGASDPEGLLKITQEAIEAGARGVIMGRNVFGHKNPAAMVKAISRIIHESESIENVKSSVL